jgi:hypothetical protein
MKKIYSSVPMEGNTVFEPWQTSTVLEVAMDGAPFFHDPH